MENQKLDGDTYSIYGSRFIAQADLARLVVELETVAAWMQCVCGKKGCTKVYLNCSIFEE